MRASLVRGAVRSCVSPRESRVRWRCGQWLDGERPATELRVVLCLRLLPLLARLVIRHFGGIPTRPTGLRSVPVGPQMGMRTSAWSNPA